MGFSFTSIAECEYCGNPLSDSTDECDECDGVPDIEVVFQDLVSGELESVYVSKIRNTNYLWQKLAGNLEEKQTLRFGLLGTREHVDKLLLREWCDDVTDISPRQHITEYSGDEDI